MKNNNCADQKIPTFVNRLLSYRIVILLIYYHRIAIKNSAFLSICSELCEKFLNFFLDLMLPILIGLNQYIYLEQYANVALDIAENGASSIKSGVQSVSQILGVLNFTKKLQPAIDCCLLYTTNSSVRSTSNADARKQSFFAVCLSCVFENLYRFYELFISILTVRLHKLRQNLLCLIHEAINGLIYLFAYLSNLFKFLQSARKFTCHYSSADMVKISVLIDHAFSRVDLGYIEKHLALAIALIGNKIDDKIDEVGGFLANIKSKTEGVILICINKYLRVMNTIYIKKND